MSLLETGTRRASTFVRLLLDRQFKIIGTRLLDFSGGQQDGKPRQREPKRGQYQSFPGEDGASLSVEKLNSLRLPALAGKSFLDIGCNEGFFCGFARFAGAARVIGLDRSDRFIERARARFPDCEFVLSDWEHLPEGKFDVILLASALHYAVDQAKLIDALMDKLTPDGTLVLEMGIINATTNEWKEVQRGIDTRLFPTSVKVQEILKPYAWKRIGHSTPQAGDPVPRYVIHVHKRKSVAYLLMQPSGYGKTTVARFLFGASHVPVVAGDEIISSVANGRLTAPSAMKDLIASQFSPIDIAKVVHMLFDAGYAKDYVDLWLGLAGEGDFAFEGYIPDIHQTTVMSLLAARGYMTIKFEWDQPEHSPSALEMSAGLAREYERTLESSAP